MAPPTRMQIARRRLRLARYGIGAATLTAFAAFGFAVRDAHPATHTATTVTHTSSAAASPSTSVISPAPQAAAPVIQSSGS